MPEAYLVLRDARVRLRRSGAANLAHFATGEGALDYLRIRYNVYVRGES